MNGQNKIAINIKPSENLPSKKTIGFVKNVKEAGFIELSAVERAGISRFLPQGFSGEHLTLALNLYSKGVRSEDLEKKIDRSLETLPGLSDKETQSLYAPSYLIATFEAYDPNRSISLQSTFKPEISISQVPETTSSSQNQFVFGKKEGIFQPLVRELAGKGVGIAKKRVKDFAIKAIKKGGKKLAKAALKKGAGIALKAGVKVAAQALGTTVPIIGNIVAFIATEVLPRIIKFVTKAISGILRAITGEKDRRKQLFLLAGAGSLILFGLGLPVAAFAALLIAVAAGAAFLGAGAIVAGVAGTTMTFVFALGGIVISAFAIPLLIALIVVPLVVVFILFIINSGGYLVPQGPSTVSALVENPYIGVEKLAKEAGSGEKGQSFLEYENSDLPVRIEYTITVEAKRATLTNISFEWRCTVIREPNQTCPSFSGVIVNGESFPNVLPPDAPDIISPANTYVITYEQLFNPGAFNDSLVIDTFTVRADVESEGVTQTEAISSASIRIGDPPDQCPQGWPVGGRYNQGPYTGSTHRNSEAVDIGANTGTGVSARHSGVARVFTVATGGPFGNSVELVSVCPGEQFFSRYSHLSSLLVNSGEFVTLGQIVGEVGSTGNSTGPHLHYEFRGLSGPRGLTNPPNILPPYVDQVINPSGNPVDPPRGCVGYGSCGSMTVP